MSSNRTARASIAVLAVLAVFATGCAYVSRASESTSGIQGNGTADEASLSADGRFVAFRSRSNNLVPFDTNGPSGFYADIFVHDAQTGAIERVNLSSTGTEANLESSAPSLSAEGRFVAYTSDATNLVAGDTNGVSDVFLCDRDGDTTARINIASNGAQANGASSTSAAAISADGFSVAFTSSASSLVAGDANAVDDVFLRDRLTGITSRLSLAAGGGDANGASSNATVSADGRYVAFESTASNLVAGDTNGNKDIFVRDTQTGVTTRVNTDSAGNQGTGGVFPGSFAPSISADGRFVSFESWATNLVPGDTNGIYEVFLKDRQTGTTSRISISTSGAQSDGGSGGSSISGDGRYVAFASLATTMVPGDTNGAEDVFVRDRQSGTTTRVSTSNQFAPGNGTSYSAVISRDGRTVAFSTLATNIVSPDVNGATQDVILRANPVPVVSGASPTTVARGASATIVVNGSNFLPGVSGGFGSGITVTNTNRVSETEVRFTITVAANAVPGARVVLVLIPGTGTGPGGGAGGVFALTIT